MTTHIINPLVMALIKLGFSVHGSQVLAVCRRAPNHPVFRIV